MKKIKPTFIWMNQKQCTPEIQKIMKNSIKKTRKTLKNETMKPK